MTGRKKYYSYTEKYFRKKAPADKDGNRRYRDVLLNALSSQHMK